MRISGNAVQVVFSRQATNSSKTELVYRQANTWTDFVNNNYTEITTNVFATNRLFTPKIGATTANIPVIQYIEENSSGVYRVAQISLMNENTWSKPYYDITDQADSLYLHTIPQITEDKGNMLWFNKTSRQVRFSRAVNDRVPPWQPAAPTAIHDDARGVNSGHAQTLNISAVFPLRSNTMYYYVTYNAQGTPVEKSAGYTASAQAFISVRDNATSNIYVTARDDAGNISLTSNVFTFFVPDRTPPQLQFDLPIRHDSVDFATGRTYFITLNAQDESDITATNVTYNNTLVPSILVQQVNPGNSKNVVISFQLKLNAEFDPTALEVMVFDKEGNYATGVSNTDDTPPLGTALLTPPNSTAILSGVYPITLTRNVRVVMNAWDIDPGDGSYVSGIRYYKFSENYADVSDPSNVAGRREFPNFISGDGARSTVNNHILSSGTGVKNVYVRYWDDAGNSYLLPNPITIMYDPNAAYFEFLEPDGINDVASDNFTISWRDLYTPDPAADIWLRYEGVSSNGVVTGSVTGDARDWNTGAAHSVLVSNQIDGLIWDTSSLPSGYYYLYAFVSGNAGAFEVKADYPVFVKHQSGAIPTPPPGVVIPPAVPTEDGRTPTLNPPSILITNPVDEYSPPGYRVLIYWQEKHTAGDGSTINIYYTRDNNYGVPYPNTIIGSITLNMLADSDPGVWEWEIPSDLPNGKYYICAVISNNYYVNYDYSSGAIVIDRTTLDDTEDDIWTYPNPVSPGDGDDVKIGFTVKEDGWKRLYIYNIRGERVWQTNAYGYAGLKNVVTWDGRLPHGKYAANGIYVLLLTDEQKKILAKGRMTILD
jgi:hypothetical protein